MFGQFKDFLPQVFFNSVKYENILEIHPELFGHSNDLVFLYGGDGRDFPEGVLYPVFSDGLDGLHSKGLGPHPDLSVVLNKGHHEVNPWLRHSLLQSPVFEVDAHIALVYLVVRVSQAGDDDPEQHHEQSGHDLAGPALPQVQTVPHIEKFSRQGLVRLSGNLNC